MKRDWHERCKAATFESVGVSEDAVEEDEDKWRSRTQACVM